MKEDIYDIREDLGLVLQTLRKKKGMTQQDLCDEYLSRTQISNIEKGKQSTTFEKILYFLDKLNLTYDELMFFMDDDYHTSKNGVLLEISKFAMAGNKNGLKKLSRKSEDLFIKYNVNFFRFCSQMAEARLILLETGNDFEKARGILEPIKDYLVKLEALNYNDLTLIGETLYIFDIDTSIILVEKALRTINENYAFYKHLVIGGGLSLNMALYALEFPDKWHLSLDYAQKAMDLSTTSTYLSTTLKAKIAYQIASYKLNNGKYDADIIKKCLEAFKLAEWNSQHQQIVQFLQKHGIEMA